MHTTTGAQSRPCDFCHAHPPRWTFPARDATWRACSPCQGLIVLDRWERLLKRAARAYLRRVGSLGVPALVGLSDHHDRFRATRVAGAPAPLAGRGR